MYPVNQVILGGDSMFNSLEDIDTQIQKMEAYRQKLKQYQGQQQTRLVWDDIDSEILPMTSEQKDRLLQDKEYAEIYSELQSIVQNELLNLVKGKIESTDRGRELLSRQLSVVRKLKNKIISDTNREMDLFNRFREYSKSNPNATYDDFLKNGL